jgi:cell division protein FtsI (penicillin-binding protein 3)
LKQFSFFRQLMRSNLVPPIRSQRAGASPSGPVQAGTIHRRLGLLHVSLFFVCWVTLICSRLVWLQVIHHKDFVDRAARQQQRTFEVAPRRGILYDRNLHELAMTVLADSVYAVPSEIAERGDPAGDAKRQALANALAKVVHSDPTDRFTSAHQIAARLNASRNFAWIARKLEPAEIARVKALNLKGVYFQQEFKRFYPNSQLAAQVLGYVGTDDNGLGGMERKYNQDLHGVPGRMLTAIDARRHVLDSQEREPDPGENLVLTIDENIQFMAERALDSALERTHAANGTIVVQDPYTGQILALAIRPTFNPNDFRHATTSLLKNHAVSDVYEPGSTFKLATYSAALDQKVTSPDQMIDCQGGKIELAGRIIHDNQGEHYGVIPVHKALEVSSDVAAVKLALKVGPDKFIQYIHDFGFGARTGVELPGETRGLLRPVRKWGSSSIGSIAIGQEIAVTPLQLVSMVSTIANGGVYLPPHILMQETGNSAGKLHPAAFHPERELPDSLPDGAHRVISTMTAAQMRKMMEGVVLYGSGKPAGLNGYSAGGKTGTAQKIDPRTHLYSKTMHIASFVGIAPVNNPVISIAVIIDNPQKGPSYYGTAVSAPVFAEVAQKVLEYLGVPHDTTLLAQPDLAKEHADPELEEDAPSEHTGDLDALFAEVNNLPADDPLRGKGNGQQPVPSAASELTSGAEQAQAAPPLAEKMPVKTIPMAEALPSAPPPPTVPVQAAEAKKETPPLEPPVIAPQPHVSGHGVVVAANRIGVPSFLGEPLRVAVEAAGTAGLALQIVGSGIAREQVPAPGSMVPPGTEIVVRFTR